MIDWCQTVLRDPRRAFETTDGGLPAPAMVVLAYGTLSVGIAIPALAALESRFPALPELTFATSGGTIAAPTLFVGILALGIGFGFLLWLVVAGLLFVGARIAGGRATFRRTLAAIGWGYLPNLLGTAAFVLVALVAVAAVPDTTLAAVVLGRDLPGSMGQVPWYLDGTGLLDARTVLPGVGTLWAGYVWLGALETVQGLSRRRALVVVGLVVLTQLPGGDPSIVVHS